ncbi:MAG: hypothetical protein AAF368_17190, partial [Planctomycetota bacterium]
WHLAGREAGPSLSRLTHLSLPGIDRRRRGLLDDFEGEGYVRVKVEARLDSGEIVDAHIYALR